MSFRPARLVVLAVRRVLRGGAVVGAVVAVAGIASALEGQSVPGSMGVSLVILQPVSSVMSRASTVGLARRGVVSIETNAPVTGPTSQVVMVEISRGDPLAGEPLRASMRTTAGERNLVEGISTPVGEDGTVPAGESAESFRLAYRIRGANGDLVRLRVRYLAVPGT